jgi:hypothetical protein
MAISSISRRCQAFLTGVIVLCNMQVLPKQFMAVVSAGAETRWRESWAIAKLITMSARKGLGEQAITYTHEALLLGYQMTGRYPDVQLLAFVLAEQVG